MQFPVDLVTSTEKIINGKRCFFVKCQLNSPIIISYLKYCTNSFLKYKNLFWQHSYFPKTRKL